MLYRVVVRIWDPIWLTVFLLWVFSVHKVTYVSYISYFMYGEKPQQKHRKPYGIPNAHNHPVKH